MAYGIDLILLDLNAIKLSVDCVMRVLGGSDMLGDQLSNRDIPVVALSTHTSQRKDCSKQQGMYFVLKPPKPIPFFFVIRSALARHHNLQMARDQKRMQHEYSPTPDMYSDSLRMKNIDYENDNGINHEINETVELLYANPNIHAHSKGMGLYVYGGLMTIDGNATTIHHNCTYGGCYGLSTSSSSSIHLVSPLTKEMISTNNGRNYYACSNYTVSRHFLNIPNFVSLLNLVLSYLSFLLHHRPLLQQQRVHHIRKRCL